MKYQRIFIVAFLISLKYCSTRFDHKCCCCSDFVGNEGSFANALPDEEPANHFSGHQCVNPGLLKKDDRWLRFIYYRIKVFSNKTIRQNEKSLFNSFEMQIFENRNLWMAIQSAENKVTSTFYIYTQEV